MYLSQTVCDIIFSNVLAEIVATWAARVWQMEVVWHTQRRKQPGLAVKIHL